jgi:hypothetical protein
MSEPTYELCYGPRDSTVLIYRSIPAGVCGPFSETMPCDSREHAERIAREHGYLVTGAWSAHTNYDSADLVRR